MYQHYLEQNCNTILLPPIFPESDKKKKLMRGNSDNRKVLKIVYAGALASKDYIDTLLQAIIRLNADEVRVIIDIIGPDKIQVQKLVGDIELEKYGIYCHTMGLASIIYDVLDDYILHASIHKFLSSERAAALEHLEVLEDMGLYNNSIIIFDRGYYSEDMFRYCEVLSLDIRKEFASTCSAFL